MTVLLVEPYYSGSHKYWADNIISFSTHNIILHSLPGKHWKWRMQGSAITLAEMYTQLKEPVDIILCSTMIDLALYKSLIYTTDSPSVKGKLPRIIYYMHENQLSYPFSIHENRKQEDFHYGFINYKSCLVSDAVVFNSHYHKNQFLEALATLLKRLPDNKGLRNIDDILSKTEVIPVGLNIQKIENNLDRHFRKRSDSPTLLWNHRWDTDKNPQLFIELCYFLKAQKLNFKLNLLGKLGNMNGELYSRFINDFDIEINHHGYVESYKEYIAILYASDLIPVTSDHDFYGISVMEAIYCGVMPILPQGKVYEEFFPLDSYSELFYSSKEELFEMTRKKIIRLSSNNTLSDKLKEQDIRNQIDIYDLYISNI